MKTAPSPANPASDTDSTPATARNSPLPGRHCQPRPDTQAVRSPPRRNFYALKIHRRAREHAGTHTPHPQLQLAVRRHPTLMANGTGAARQGGKMTGPAGAVLRPRRASGRFYSVNLAVTNHGTAWTWEQFLSPPPSHPQSFQPGSSSWMRPRCKGRVHFGNGK